MELKSKFDHLQTQAGKYEKWLENDVFKADVTSDKEPYSIILPPPNVTGKLHLGHAWDVTLQDILIRYKKMQGFEAMWIPGMDHAGIATQAKVEERLRESGISRHDLGREKFLEHAWSWKDEYANIIREQWAKLGLALDYSQEKFTLDTDVNKAVNKVFTDLYNQGLIYRGHRITNWDPVAKTALSDIEVIHQDVIGHEHYFKYISIENPNEYLEVMTTRPETMFGDAALAVHPDDERYQHLVGKEYIIPNTNTTIPVIADEYVSIEKGSGVVKITKAHDPNDYEVALRHNLETRIVMDEEAKMAENKWVPVEFQGLDRFDARKKQVEMAKENGLLIKVEEIEHSVGHSERSGAVVEPLLSNQWYVKMEELANNALAHQKTNDKINFVPERFENTFNTWMENIQDWCISRQLWWGHQIPAWYNENGEIYVGESAPVGEGWQQDEDVLDTWFSSALWPFVTTKWTDNEDLAKFYPTSTLVTGYDIIFFWVSRMIFQGLHFTEEKPFADVLIHGLIRAEDGRKMSKSLGNGIDPMDVIEEHGADALRFFLTTNSTPGQDLRYSQEKLESSWNFINKIWNISRFVLMNTENIQNQKITDYQEYFDVADYAIINQLNEVISHVNKMMDRYEFGEVARTLYNFIWDDFAAWYVEIAKISLNNEDGMRKEKTQVILKTVLKDIIKFLHPFMPFVTDEIYSQLEIVNSVLLTTWPQNYSIIRSEDNIKEFNLIKEIIVKTRNLRQENEIKPSEPLEMLLQTEARFSAEGENILLSIGRLKTINYISEMPQEDVMSMSFNNVICHVKTEGVIDNDAKIQKLREEIKKLETEIMRSVKMLTNEKFVAKAPEFKIKEEKTKASKYVNTYTETVEILNSLGSEVEEVEILTTIKNILSM